jgi:hypothetical protein
VELGYLQCSEVDHIVNVWVLLEDLVEGSLVRDVAFVEGRSLAADELNAVYDFFGRVVQVVDDDDLVVCFEEGESREGANVAGTTGPLSVPLVSPDIPTRLDGGVEG